MVASHEPQILHLTCYLKF